jgi:ABC-type Fe3+ transport system substrate-binding protein
MFMKDNRGTVSHFVSMVVAWNKDRVTEAEVPTTLEAMANPALKGRIGRTAFAGGWVAAILQVYGEAEGMKLLESLGKQDMIIVETNTELLNGVAAGTIPIGIDARSNRVQDFIAKGAPMGLANVDPTFLQVDYVMIMNDAPNPYGAAIAYDWILSASGGQRNFMGGLLGPREDVDYGVENPLKGQRKVTVESAEMLADVTRFDDIFQRLFVRR